MQVQLLRPGFMVALHCLAKGGVSYDINRFGEEIQETAEETSEEPVENNTTVETWETTKVVADKVEFKQAAKVRGMARYEISKLCVKSPFGLLCPEVNEDELNEAIIVAKGMISMFNETSKYTKISLYVLKGRIATTDEQAARAIAAEMRTLLDETGAAIRKMDPEAIRETITRANEVSRMLVLEEQEKVSTALELARVAAREIKKTIKKKGEAAIDVAKDYRAELLALEKASSNFLSFEDPVSALKPEDEAPGVQVKELDLDDSLILTA